MIKIASKDGTYALKRQIGEGSYAVVYLGQRSPKLLDKEYFAVKVFNKSELQKHKKYVSGVEGFKIVTAYDNLESEIKIMETLNHPNVVRLYELIRDDINNRLYLVIDLIDRGQILYWNGNDKRYICPFFTDTFYPEDDARIVFQQLLCAVEYLHLHKIVHRDLKPENILINSKGEVKLIDFGIAHIFEGATLEDSELTEKNTTFISRNNTGLLGQTEGTFEFLPPECCTSESYSGFQVDMWAMGCILYALFYSKLPFYKDNPSDLFTSIENDPVQLGTREISIDGKDLVLKLLEKDPKQRITIKDCFTHRWVTNHNNDILPRCSTILSSNPDQSLEEKRQLMRPKRLLNIPVDLSDIHYINVKDEELPSRNCCNIY